MGLGRTSYLLCTCDPPAKKHDVRCQLDVKWHVKKVCSQAKSIEAKNGDLPQNWLQL